MKEILNNPPAVIGVGGLHHLLRAAPPPALFPRSLLGKQPTGPPGGGQAAGPARRAGRAPAGRARSGSTLERHGPKKWFQAPFGGIGGAILDQIPRTRLKKVRMCDFGVGKVNFFSRRGSIS